VRIDELLSKARETVCVKPKIGCRSFPADRNKATSGMLGRFISGDDAFYSAKSDGHFRPRRGRCFLRFSTIFGSTRSALSFHSNFGVHLASIPRRLCRLRGVGRVDGISQRAADPAQCAGGAPLSHGCEVSCASSPGRQRSQLSLLLSGHQLLHQWHDRNASGPTEFGSSE